MNTTHDEPRSLKRALASEVITASDVRPADHVTIAGAEHLEILIEFVRRGFSHVFCVSADHGPRMAISPADLIIALNLRTEAALRDVLARLGRDLRPRGVLVMSFAGTCSPFNERHLRRLLMENGFMAVERAAGHGDAGILWCAYKEAASMRHAA
jgi:hypothetical protein